MKLQKLKLDRKSMLLYAVTDRAWLGAKSLSMVVREALEGGASFIQLREKNLPFDEFLAEANEIKELCKEYMVPFVINDNVDVALACDADGVHLGQDDMSPIEARKMLGDNKIIGISAVNLEQAILAEKQGADYLGVGAVFPTSTKEDADYVSYEELKKICEAVSIPVVAIGGIGANNIMELKGSGIDGISVVSAIFAQKNIKEATENLLKLSKEMVSSK
ncbi:thiamine phosphate synthase [Caproiciproducens sp. MSJ-32]|uniref:thiamine phosphate synthase n=1 Tax=Caproiciproducens sp. MSJ-32 TaxID=2841527 RepID=UPI00257078D6|nr:thiamine phosphate synthase [Caproiciproducens sp. MSJ-32]